MPWTCPECEDLNEDDDLRCACGYEKDYYMEPSHSIKNNKTKHVGGGIGRLVYCVGVICILVVYSLLPAPQKQGFTLEVWVLIFFALVLTFFRLRNIGKNTLWTFLMFIPLLNFIVILQCLACPEDYQHTKKIDTFGKLISIIIMLPMLCLVFLWIWMWLSTEFAF